MAGDTLRRQAINSSGKKKPRSNYEFCKVCNLNHDQGPKHKYFPSHKKSLSSYLSRFQSKVGDVLFFLKNPGVLSPELALRNRFWCSFCDVDVVELDSCFACEKAIKHLSSVHHLNHLKQFAWKYGGVMDHLDRFRILDDDVTKWKKKCEALNKEEAASEEVSYGPLSGHSHDIHNKPVYGIHEHFGNNVNAVNLSTLNDVMPLQYCTNEYQTPLSANVGIAEIGTSDSNQTSHVLMDGFHLGNIDSDSLTGCTAIQHHVHSRSMNVFMDSAVNNQVNRDKRVMTPKNRSLGCQYLTQASSLVKEESQGNVHSGAAPPWLDISEQSQFDSSQKPSASFVSLHNNSGSSRKLNPKRVGAAWAEKRKMELELEKKGEFVKSTYGADWLPDFGRVWQSGTRKASRKEFEMEKEKLPNGENQSEMPIEVQPYVSKRVRKDVTG